MKLKRYDLIASQAGSVMKRCDDGDWVDAEIAQLYVDTVAQQAKRIEWLEARLAELENVLTDQKRDQESN